MKKLRKKFQMRVSQINPGMYILKLVLNGAPREHVVFETISSKVPTTTDLIASYQNQRKFF